MIDTIRLNIIVIVRYKEMRAKKNAEENLMIFDLGVVGKEWNVEEKGKRKKIQ